MLGSGHHAADGSAARAHGGRPAVRRPVEPDQDAAGLRQGPRGVRASRGLVEGKAVDAAGVKALADLPTREELRARLLSVIQAPQRQFVTVLAAPLRGLATVIQAHADKEGDASAA